MNRRTKEILRRLLSFLVIFSILPAAASVCAALLYRGGGIRNTSSTSLGVLVWRTDYRFLLQQIFLIALGNVVVTVVLGLVSLFAWRSEDRYQRLRLIRFVILVWLVAIILYPGVAGWIPIVRWLPWIVTVCIMLIIVGYAYGWRGARAGIREWAFALFSLTFLFYSPRFNSVHLNGIAKRQFTDRDVIIIGFDSINANDTIDTLRYFQPSHGVKTLFTNAQTPFPATSVTWRSILSGHYPPREAIIPGFRWGSDSEGWLPIELRRAGYDPTFAQDMPAANWYGKDEGIRISSLQGWKASIESVVWKAGFPLSSVGANWWVEILGGPSKSFGRPAHCVECFIDDSLEEMAQAASKGPVFWAIHTCYAHGPHQLTFTEAISVPGWWRMPSGFFLGQGKTAMDPRSRTTRIDSIRRTLIHTLTLLDNGGVLGRATVFVLGDHGPRDEGVPKAETDNVMLAMFSPGERISNSVAIPVSLVDIAPTIRQILGFPDVKTDGLVLPHWDFEGNPLRFVRTTEVRSTKILDTLKISNRSFTAEELEKLGMLQSDGTFDYSRELIDKLKTADFQEPKYAN